MTNQFKHIPVALLTLLSLLVVGCDKDGDTLYTNGPDDAKVISSASDIVLDKDHLQALALTVYWNENGDISLSDERVAAPTGAASNTIQFASDPQFSNMVEDNVSSGVYYRQYTCESLNSIVARLGFEGGEKRRAHICPLFCGARGRSLP